MREDVLIAIPARGGSKRLPRKNICDLGGQPMLSYTVRAALESGLSEDIYVCTEDKEIAATAEEYGARAYWIPEEMAGDEVSSTVPCLELCDHLASEGKQFEYIFNLQPTSPLRTEDDLTEALWSLEDSRSDFLVSVTPTDPHYFHWAMVMDSEGWRMHFRDEFLKERPQLPPVFRPNGAIKLARASAVKSAGNFFGQPLTVHEMPEERSIHVATEFDLLCAMAMIQKAKSVEA